MSERSAIFIDGAYLFYLLRDEFGSVRIDYRLLALVLSEGTDLLRSYYYSALPY